MKLIRELQLHRWAGIIVTVLMIAGTLLPAGCTAPPSGAKTFVFITNGDSAYWYAAEQGWKDKAAQLGLQAEFLRNSDGSAAGQIRLLDQVLTRDDVAGVAVSVVNASAGGILDRMKKLGEKVPLVTVDSDTRPEDHGLRRTYVGTDNKDAGDLAGRVAVELFPEGGTWIGFVGAKDADNARARIEGFAASAKGFEQLDLMQDQHGREKAMSNVRAALPKKPNLLVGFYSYNAPAIAREVKDPQNKGPMKIVTFDAEEATIPSIANGMIDASIVQSPYDMGASSLAVLAAYAKEDKAGVDKLLAGKEFVDTGIRVVVPDDSTLKLEGAKVEKVGDFKKFLESKGLKSS